MLNDSALRSCQARLVVATRFSVALMTGNRQRDPPFGGGHNSAIGRSSSRSKPVKRSALGRVALRAEPRKPRVRRLRYTACNEKRLTLMNHDAASAKRKQATQAIAMTSRRTSGKYR